ncbi:histidinol dehydrogenase, partial [Patescibacteria group bacterium]|nr:histidinol dehydrogenase [Patescibacteria group bacterium]
MLKIVKGKAIEEEIRGFLAKRTFSFNKEKNKVVLEIIEKVGREGDKALITFAKKFDKQTISLEQLRVSSADIDEAAGKVNGEFVDAVKTAVKNLLDFHKRQKEAGFEYRSKDAILGMRLLPLESAGVYVPGGRAAYASSVLMNVVPAKLAGVSRIIMASPPPIDPHVLVAASIVGVSDIFRVGGAQAIAAMALGTGTIPKVDKVVGPGNLYVTLAKKHLYGTVGIDSLAGPSDVL